MTIRSLTFDEFGRLAEFEALRDNPPDPRLARVVVAEDENAIVGYWILQLIAVAEPIYLMPEHRNGLVGGRMFEELQRMLREESVLHYAVHASSEEIAQYCERLGMKRTGRIELQGHVNG